MSSMSCNDDFTESLWMQHQNLQKPCKLLYIYSFSFLLQYFYHTGIKRGLKIKDFLGSAVCTQMQAPMFLCCGGLPFLQWPQLLHQRWQVTRSGWQAIPMYQSHPPQEKKGAPGMQSSIRPLSATFYRSLTMKYHTSVSSIASLNPITSPNLKSIQALVWFDTVMDGGGSTVVRSLLNCVVGVDCCCG